MDPRRAAALLAPAVLAVHSAPALSAHSAWLRRHLAIRDRLDDREGVALTFDDGPHREGTPAVLEILAAADAKATFFMAAEQVAREPALAAEVAAAGHEVALHCQRHRNLLRLTPSQVAHDLDRAHETIIAATARAPRFWRPPYGVMTAAGLAHARRRGWEPVLWTRWGRDWRARATPASVAAESSLGLRGGEVVLLHDADHYSATGSWQTTATALPRILDNIEQVGLRAALLP